MATQDVSVKVPKTVLGELAELGKTRDRSGAGELRQAALAWISINSRDPHGEQEDTPGATDRPDEVTLGLNLSVYASMYGTLAALASSHERDLNGEVRAAIRAWFRMHAPELGRLEVANNASYRRG